MELVTLSAWLVLLVLLTGTLLARARQRRRQSALLGSAHFARGRELGAFTQPSPLLVGHTAWGRPVYVGPQQLEGHVTVLGPTRRGKTSRELLPLLLREDGQDALVIFDPKGELYAHSAGALARRGYQVRRFAPFAEDGGTACYNPLLAITTMEQARDLATAVIENTGVSREPFWDRNAELLITAAVLHLRTSAPDAPYGHLAELLTLPLGSVKHLLCTSPDPIAAQLGIATFDALEKAERTGGGIKLDIISRFFPFLGPRMRQVTATSTVTLPELLEPRSAFYLLVPQERADQVRPLVSLLILQLLETLIARANAAGGRLPCRVLFCLEEFYTLGTIPRFTTYISTLGGYGVSLVMALQNLAQLEARYGKEGKETILANTNTAILLPGLFEEDAAWFSRAMGERTVESTSRSQSQPVTFLGLPAGKRSVGTSRSQQHRALLTPDELERLPPDHALLRYRGTAPLVVRTRAYYADRRLAARARLAPPDQPSTLPPVPPPLAGPGSLAPRLPPLGLPGSMPPASPDDPHRFHLP